MTPCKRCGKQFDNTGDNSCFQTCRKCRKPDDNKGGGAFLSLLDPMLCYRPVTGSISTAEFENAVRALEDG